MKETKIRSGAYVYHPIYNKYASCKNGYSLDIVKEKDLIEIEGSGGCLFFNIDKKIYPVEKFIFETFNGVIPEDKVVIHIDGNKRNNSLINLKLIPKENEVGIMDCLHKIENILLSIKDEIEILRYDNYTYFMIDS